LAWQITGKQVPDTHALPDPQSVFSIQPEPSALQVEMWLFEQPVESATQISVWQVADGAWQYCPTLHVVLWYSLVPLAVQVKTWPSLQRRIPVQTTSWHAPPKQAMSVNAAQSVGSLSSPDPSSLHVPASSPSQLGVPGTQLSS
jgi:hypothetical protein